MWFWNLPEPWFEGAAWLWLIWILNPPNLHRINTIWNSIFHFWRLKKSEKKIEVYQTGFVRPAFPLSTTPIVSWYLFPSWNIQSWTINNNNRHHPVRCESNIFILWLWSRTHLTGLRFQRKWILQNLKHLSNPTSRDLSSSTLQVFHDKSLTYSQANLFERRYVAF